MASDSALVHEYDVVIVGAGIIGLTIARHFLISSDLSVAIIDKKVPCSGATGAGQGYLWMIYKTPGSVIWDLSQRSHQLWKMLAQSLEEEGLDPMVELGWKKCGIYLHLSINFFLSLQFGRETCKFISQNLKLHINFASSLSWVKVIIISTHLFNRYCVV